MVKIVVDSTADIPDDLRETYDVSVVPLNVRFGEETFRDSVDITRDEFYRRLVTGNEMPATSTPMLGSFVETYQRLARETDQIISIHISSKLSGTAGVARQAAAQVSDARIAVIDSRFSAMVMVFMAMEVTAAAQAGKRFEELVELVEDMSRRSFLYIGLDTLRYLEKGGRIGKARALLGTLLNVKPLVDLAEGEIHPLEQVRTSKRMRTRLAELAYAQQPLEHLALLYTSDRVVAEDVADQIAQASIMPRDRIYVVQMGGVVGTHIGPGGIGVCGVRVRG